MDDSLQKIQLTIRKEDPIPSKSLNHPQSSDLPDSNSNSKPDSNINPKPYPNTNPKPDPNTKSNTKPNTKPIPSESKPTNTPRRSATFASLPPREPLNINSSASTFTRKSISSIKLKHDELLFNNDKSKKEKEPYDSNSPIRRNRFPSFTDQASELNSSYIRKSLKGQPSARQLSFGIVNSGNSSSSLTPQSRSNRIGSNDIGSGIGSNDIGSGIGSNDIGSDTGPAPDSNIPNAISNGSEKPTSKPASKPSLHANRLDSAIYRSRNVFFDKSNKANSENKTSNQQSNIPVPNNTKNHSTIPNKKTTDTSPTRKFGPRISKTPIRLEISRASSTVSTFSDRSKMSKSPTKYDHPPTKNSSLASTSVKDDDTLVPLARFMSPTRSSTAKTNKYSKSSEVDTGSTKNRFLTTTLNPNNTGPVKPHNNHISPIKKKTTSDETGPKPGKELSIPPLDANPIPSLKKKSLMAQRSEAAAMKPKQKLVISMNHNKGLKLPGTSKLDRSAMAPHKPNEVSDLNKNQPLVRGAASSGLEDRVSGNKRRHLTGNAVALPEAARRPIIPDTNRQMRPLSRPTAMDDNKPRSSNKQEFQQKTPRKILLPDFELFHDGKSNEGNIPVNNILEPEQTLPDIDTDDDENPEKKILSSWADSPELHRLTLRNKEMDPVTIFGQVPKFRIEDVFESEASRLRGGPSPGRDSRERMKKVSRDY